MIFEQLNTSHLSVHSSSSIVHVHFLTSKADFWFDSQPGCLRLSLNDVDWTQYQSETI